MRVFAGLPLPRNVMDRLSMLRLRIAAPKDGLRWTTEEQWHITLRFFGEVDEEVVPELTGALSALRVSPVRLQMEQLGSFPAKGILFVDVKNSPELMDLQRQVESVTARCGLLPESRPFHPHITLARSRNRAGLATLRKLTTPQPPSFGAALSWDANRLWVYKSELQAGGARYSTLNSLELCSEPIAGTTPD